MPDFVPEWRNNRRGNLVLWPDVAGNIAVLADADGQPYDEQALLGRFGNLGTEEKRPNDARTVRNTFEIMALSGLAYRDDGETLRLTPLGRLTFSYLLPHGGGRSFANDNNIDLLGRCFVRGLGVIGEYRIIWKLIRHCDNYLTNEELNRALGQIDHFDDAANAADLIKEARAAGDPTRIGPRSYADDEYGTEREGEHRKAMNVHFRLAGAGGMLISVSRDTDDRRLAPWAVPLVDRELEREMPLEHASTEPASALLISAAAAVPPGTR